MYNLLALSYALVLATFIINIGIALYGIFVKTSILKKIMAVIIFSDSINILAVSLGFRVGIDTYASPPVLSSIPDTPEHIITFTRVSVDPLPQAFVITAVVIGLSVIILLLALAVKYHEYYNSLHLMAEPEAEEYEEIL